MKLYMKSLNMSRRKQIDDRKRLLIRYRIDEKGLVCFIDPCCDNIPVALLGKILEAISNVEKEWNCRVANDINSFPPDITYDDPIFK